MPALLQPETETTMRHRIPAEWDIPLMRLENSSGLAILLNPNGVPFAFRLGGTLINRALVSGAEKGWFRLVARIVPKDGGAAKIVDLLDPPACTRFTQTGPLACLWTGSTASLKYQVALRLAPDSPTWGWTVDVTSTAPDPAVMEVFYGQDLGLGDEGAVRNNEAYISQYLDHHVADSDAYGTVVLTRQNMPMVGERHPWIAQGCRDGLHAFSTDGFQFFGPATKAGALPLAFTGASLPSVVRQFEFAYTGLQSRPVDLLSGQSHRANFFAAFEAHHPEASSAADLHDLPARLAFLDQPAPVSDETDEAYPIGASTLLESPPVNGRDLDDRALASFFPGVHRNVERDADGHLLSFFHGTDCHVATARKEVRMERAHGHILWSSPRLDPDVRALGSTVYANGIFNAQTYLGNPNFGRFLSVVRCPLNQLRLNGQRVFLELDGEWRQLGVPSAFETGPRLARWLYDLEDFTILLTAWPDTAQAAVFLNVATVRGPAVRLLVTHQLVPGANEFNGAIDLVVDEARALATGVPQAPATVLGELPGYAFLIAAAEFNEVVAISTRLPGSDDSGFLAIESQPTRSFTVVLSAGARGPSALEDTLPYLREAALAGFQEDRSFRDTHAGGIRLSDGPSDAIARLDEIIPWYAHNAWIHFATPHGLEQYNGGAWGVRDVCQGSMEWLLAVGEHATARGILVSVFSQQYRTDPVWPQWFMLAPFEKIQQAHAHGDIPFWPLKALCDYLEVTRDYGFIDTPLPYTKAETFETEGPAETVGQHIERVFDHFHSRCVPGTALVNYGDGDWDDTLQPADPVLRSSMVSTWTVALSYHVFRQYRDVCLATGRDDRATNLTDLLARIAADFRRHLMPGGIACGFAVVESDGRFRPLLHPDDSASGIGYRLLPMTRAILAGLFTREEAERHLQIIADHLLFPDGVHLMSDPVKYCGGISRQFKRAETAAFFGREVGLQYVHAHIRYAEALAEMGLADEAWQAMSAVNPVGIGTCVPNAAIRQCNAYFSSSDARFSDRYEAGERFDELRQGKIPVSGGWRIYSSGPGIFLHKIVTRLAGMREHHDDLIFDPLLPADQPRLVVRRNWRGHDLEIVIHRKPGAARQLAVNGFILSRISTAPNAYRTGGMITPIDRFIEHLSDGKNSVEIIVV